MNLPAEPAAPAIDAGRRLAWRLFFGLMILVAISVVLATKFRHQLTAIGNLFVEHFGLLGVWAGVALADSSPIPIAHEPLLFLGIAGGLTALGLVVAGSLGSMVAALAGYGAGTVLRHYGLTHRLLGPRTRKIEDLVARYGAWAVALAAVTPVPFGLCNWAAGALKIPLKHFLMAACMRIVKMIVTVWLIVAGWNLGAG